MNKNPFSIYDFLGYLFPGFVAITLVIYIILINDNDSIESFFSIKNFVKLYGNTFKDYKWESAAIVLILSYIAGHIISYLSSTIVEYLMNKTFGYPSWYLLNKQKYTLSLLWNSYYTKDTNCGKKIWRSIVILIMIPVSFVIFVFSVKSSLIKFIVRPLDEYTTKNITAKLKNLFEKLGLTHHDIEAKDDYHRIVMHYVYINIPNSQRKLDNYVAMYGFLRALTLISCLLFDYLIYKQFCTISNYLTNGFEGSINSFAITILFILFIICNVLFMAFVKFYRRFTLENYMALLTEKNHETVNIPTISLSIKQNITSVNKRKMYVLEEESNQNVQ